jgi:hypothetical protein
MYFWPESEFKMGQLQRDEIVVVERKQPAFEVVCMDDSMSDDGMAK